VLDEGRDVLVDEVEDALRAAVVEQVGMWEG
jgi:hypothetical protein